MKDIYVSIYRSQIYKDLLWQVEKIQRQAKSDTDNTELAQKLAEARGQLKAFTNEAMALAIELENTPLNTNQLRLARQHFDIGDYVLARTLLNKTILLPDSLEIELPVIDDLTKQTPLIDDTAKVIPETVNHSLTDLQARMCASFDEALKHMGRIPEILFDYAQFLQENNQYPTAERLYRETLAIYRERALADATGYLSEISVTLNNLAYLIQTTLTRRHEVELLYQEALANYRKLVVLHPTVYQPHLANVLWGFAEANMYWQELEQAILLLDEAAMLLAPFAKAYPAIFAIRQDAIQHALEQTKSALEINSV